MDKPDDLPATLAECERRQRRLSRLLSAVGFIWPGTLQRRSLTCGKPRCACHADPAARHGPYFYWTTKKDRKTVSRKLSEEEAQIIEAWIGNRRTVEAILKQMNQVSERALELLLRGDPER